MGGDITGIGYSISARDLSDNEIFVIRKIHKLFFNHQRTYKVFAPLPNGSDYENAEPLVTIQRNLHGTGVFGKGEIYKIYEGRVKDNKPLYYGVTGINGK